MALYVGDDWSEDRHDVHLMNEAGERLAARRLPEGVEGIAALHGLVAEHALGPGEVVVGIETDRGPWVAALVAAGYHVYAVNPRAVARYRERHHVGGGKSDAGDAKVLADLVRTDRHNHREVAGDTAEAGAVRILARAHQQLIRDRVRVTNRLRNALREYFPAALQAFPNLAHSDAVGVLAKAPGPREAARLTLPQLRAALRRGGRQRNLERRAAEVRAALRAKQLDVLAAASRAFAATTRAAVAQIEAINRQIAELEAELESSLEEHPDAEIYRSMPGLGAVLGARVLGEFGDDPERYESAKSRRNYAGTSPLTVASGRKHTVRARFVRNRRLSDAVDRWAMCSLRASPGCRAFYDRRRAVGDLHHQALRALGNRLVGYLHGCLRARTLYDETVAWGHRSQLSELTAA
ncbi:MAG: IS110 family transposase [Candidatus Dadabacteria bacterium]|nr:IS110 family transposase [Candidatus Dadabacteria bacterium]MYI85878.1 IS110 family transposase [Dehalococcoidia bacterium]